MELLWLKYFQTAASLGHITKAAEQLYISQPALSKIIRLLEDELQAPLFDRVGKRVELNENGRILLKYTNRIFAELESARTEIGETSEKGARTVRFSVLAGSQLLPDILMKFRRLHPDISFSLQQQPTGESGGSYDLQLFSSAQPLHTPGTQCLLREEILLAIPQKHPLASRDSISLTALKEAPFISLQQGLGLSNIMDYYCQMIGFTPHVVMESDSPATLRSLIQLGMGVSFLPAATWNVRMEGVKLMHISDFDCFRYLLLKQHEDRYLTQAAATFRDFLAEYFRTGFSGQPAPQP